MPWTTSIGCAHGVLEELFWGGVKIFYGPPLSQIVIAIGVKVNAVFLSHDTCQFAEHVGGILRSYGFTGRMIGWRPSERIRVPGSIRYSILFLKRTSKNKA